MRVVFNLIAILILTSISSCSSWKTDFNNQKYTSLNKIKQEKHENSDALHNIIAQCNHENTQETTTIVDNIQSRNIVHSENTESESVTIKSESIIDDIKKLTDEQNKCRLPIIHTKADYWSNIDWKKTDKNPDTFSKKNKNAPSKGGRITLGIVLFLVAVFVALLAYASMSLGGIEVAVALILATAAILTLSINQFIRAIKGDKKKKSKTNSKIWGIIVLTLGCMLMVLGPLLIMAVAAYPIPIFFFLVGLILAIIGGIMIKKSI
jgi:hypothetical protein